MASFEQYTFKQGRQVGNVDMSAANAWESLSDTLSGFSQTLLQVSKAQKQEYQEGVKEYVEGMESDIITNLAKVAIDRENDYEHYDRFVTAYKKGTLAGIEDPNIKAAAGKMIDDKAVQYGKQVFQNHVNIRNARQRLAAEKSLEIHAVDTEHLIGETVSTWYNQPEFRDSYIESVGPIFQTQRDMFSNKIDGLVQLGKTSDAAIADELGLLQRFYEKAAMAELTANMEEGNGWQTIQEFNADPSKFFSSRPQLQALFPEVKISMSDEVKAETFKDMMSMLNGYQGQQDRMQAAIAADKAVEHANQYSFILDRIVEDPTSVTTDEIKQTLENDGISNKEHDTLLKIIQTGGLYSEDGNIVSGLYNLLFDPNADQFYIYDQIQQAVKDNQIKPATQKQLLSILRDGTLKDVTKDEDYQLARNEVKSLGHCSGPMCVLKPDETDAINRANRELFQLRKTLQPGQDFFTEFDKMMKKYKRVVETAKTTVSWQSGWVGTAETPNAEETKDLLAQQLESNQITQSQYLEQFEAIEAYMEAYKLRKGRKE